MMRNRNLLQAPPIRFANTLLRRNVWFVGTFQAALVLCSFVCAWLLRFDFSIPNRHLLLTTAPILILVRLATIAYFRLLHGWWRYVGVSDVLDIGKAVLTGSICFFVIVRIGLGLASFPKSIYIAEALLTAGLLAGIRLLSRLIAESVRQDISSAKKVVVIGAGAAAQMVLRELKAMGSGYQVLGCLDDDRMKVGSKAQGVPVLGTVDRLPSLFAADASDCEAIIAIPSATSVQMQRFVKLAGEAGMRYRTVPALRELITGNVLLPQIREVNLNDLLGREPVALDLAAVHEKVNGRSVMVTGAAGSIGSELCLQILQFAPAKLVCLDQNENGIFYLNRELERQNATAEVMFCVADVRDRERLRKICLEHQVQIVFHAAAYKHVPVMESNIEEAVQNNVFALLTLLDVAEEARCTDLVLISSDKAVKPTSVMGATKRICEVILSSRPPNGLRCASVRFGNVLGSSGSVVPLFQEQLRRNTCITITHPEIQRFFMTIQEAVSLVLQAFAIGIHGDVLVLDMGEPIKIVDLAKSLARLAGKSEEQIEIQFTGLRPGEKLTEELFYPAERILYTTHPKIKRTQARGIAWTQLLEKLDNLREATAVGESIDIVEKMRLIIPEFSYQDEQSRALIAESCPVVSYKAAAAGPS
jgi:FlaA1/EpsC-like NDP-sugar epimerase